MLSQYCICASGFPTEVIQNWGESSVDPSCFFCLVSSVFSQTPLGLSVSLYIII